MSFISRKLPKDGDGDSIHAQGVGILQTTVVAVPASGVGAAQISVTPDPRTTIVTLYVDDGQPDVLVGPSTTGTVDGGTGQTIKSFVIPAGVRDVWDASDAALQTWYVESSAGATYVFVTELG